MCDHLYYVAVVLANFTIFTAVSRYHICGHTCYMPMVPADHSKNSTAGRYHICDHLCYASVVLAANYSKNNTVASTICVIIYTMYLWY